MTSAAHGHNVHVANGKAPLEQIGPFCDECLAKYFVGKKLGDRELYTSNADGLLQSG